MSLMMDYGHVRSTSLSAVSDKASHCLCRDGSPVGHHTASLSSPGDQVVWEGTQHSLGSGPSLPNSTSGLAFLR